MRKDKEKRGGVVRKWRNTGQKIPSSPPPSTETPTDN